MIENKGLDKLTEIFKLDFDENKGMLSIRCAFVETASLTQQGETFCINLVNRIIE